MGKATLYIFAISHFCEKARWALDYLEIDHDIVYLAPGIHAAWAKRNGLPTSTLPILDTGTENGSIQGLIQGSKNIIDWAEAVTTSNRTLIPYNGLDACLQIEKRLDEISGVHTRRMFYSEALIEHSASVRSIFIQDLTIPQKLLVSALWPVARRSMIQSMDLGVEQGLESKMILDQELEWLDSMLAGGRRFLVGDSFSRADITASSLFARLAQLPPHPRFRSIELPPHARQTAEEWVQRPSMRAARDNYREFR